MKCMLKAKGTSGMAWKEGYYSHGCGLQAGVCFGLSAACCKTGLQLIARVGWLSFPLGLAASILMSSLGFMLQTLGLKDGNTVVVCTCAAVSSMATGERSQWSHVWTCACRNDL